jgi:heptosyltransferase-1
MYKTFAKPASILIVKTSSLGDIVQAFSVLNDLKARFPDVALDWAVELPFHAMVAAHPLVRRAIALERRNFSSLQALRKEEYDIVFDLQGNCKSGLITLLARAKDKVGYSFKSVREWPNILATRHRFKVARNQNIRLYYLGLVEQYFQAKAPVHSEGVRLLLSPQEEEKVTRILAPLTGLKIMVCPGSKWANKQLDADTLIAFLKKVAHVYSPSFLLVWGSALEKTLCTHMQSRVPNAHLLDRLALPTWQNLMAAMDLVIAVDSSALHLCATTTTPTLSFFGPTSPHVFKPMGPKHLAIQGSCPYQRTFEKQCPLLRSCPTGRCIKDLQANELFSQFVQWLGPLI